MKVYVVTSGQYSDYRIVAIFSTQDKADAFIHATQAGREYSDLNSHIAVYEVDEADGDTQHIERGEWFYTAKMERNGNSHVYESDDSEQPRIEEAHFERWGQRGNTSTTLVVSRWSTSEEAVVKVANDLRAQHLANETWPPDAGNQLGVLP